MRAVGGWYVRVIAARAGEAQPSAVMPPRAPSGRLHLLLQRTGEEVFEPDSVSDAPLIRFAAYGTDHRVFGWIRLAADRLTDLLNEHEELHLDDVEIESLETGAIRSLAEIVIHRRDLIAVHASGPRGDEALRLRTRSHPVAVQAGSYLVGGYLHAVPGVDPLASARLRPSMLPLTDAWIEYWSGAERKHHSIGTIIVNRDAVAWLRVVTDEDLIGGELRPTFPDSPGLAASQG